MASPVSSVSTNINTIQRASQTPSVSNVASRQASATPARVPNNKPSAPTITLASANSTPPANLPRGSIVDKLV